RRFRNDVEAQRAAQVRRQEDRQRLARFWQRHDEALLHATLFAGLNRTAGVEATRRAAETALAEYGLPAQKQLSLSAHSSPEEQKEIRDAGCELVLVLADAVATPPEGKETPDAERDRLCEAIRLVDLADGLGIVTRAGREQRASYLKVLGDADGAAAEEARAA